ncbi:MAG: hypothetical protein VKN72_16500 [Nostocales cyanobacterium 94392]|nr:hypothetical protein [Nostocales cyanobacterium 94392]
MPANGCTYEEIIAKLPEKSESKSHQKSRQKSSGKGFALDSHPVAV